MYTMKCFLKACSSVHTEIIDDGRRRWVYVNNKTVSNLTCVYFSKQALFLLIVLKLAYMLASDDFISSPSFVIMR